ncbi:hypothetical protein ANN_23119 [Periplaneta americana]|uniref:Uncharacterized protein n=1 Tax=Periplaneta americana TaxID=6978 RepID=A0ABQ8SLN2_PERAM|nr:hypothetical protein ANN_23119 [Periplaneta americana]
MGLIPDSAHYLIGFSEANVRRESIDFFRATNVDDLDIPVKTPNLISKICILNSKCVPGSDENKVRDKLEQVLQRNIGLKDLRTASDILVRKNTVYNVTFLCN